MAVDENPEYKPKGDFGPYNEPSWVPEGKCKACATIQDPVTRQQRRRTPDELEDMTVYAYTTNQNLPVRSCKLCDVPNP